MDTRLLQWTKQPTILHVCVHTHSKTVLGQFDSYPLKIRCKLSEAHLSAPMLEGNDTDTIVNMSCNR